MRVQSSNGSHDEAVAVKVWAVSEELEKVHAILGKRGKISDYYPWRSYTPPSQAHLSLLADP